MYDMQFTPQRLERVHRAMQREEVELLLITRPQDVQYLTGYHVPRNYLPTACLIPMDEKPQLLISDLQHEFLGQDTVMSDVFSYVNDDTDSWYPRHGSSFWNHIIDTIAHAECHDRMIGLQQDWLSVRDFERLKSALPDAGFKDFSTMLWRLRQVKDAAEIDAISQATRIAEIGVMTALELISTEKSEADVSIEVESAMRKAGGHQRGIRAAVLSGISARFPFAFPGPQRINDDVPVVIDVTVSHLGYFSEIARTIHLGKPSKKQRDLFETNLRLLEKIEEGLSAHTPINDLVLQADSMMTGKANEHNVLLPYGSAIGLDLHEPPHLLVESTDTLRPGMVLSVHPTCYDKKVGCTKISDIFVISEDGCGSISTLAREIM